jgi:hypothetical protein
MTTGLYNDTPTAAPPTDPDLTYVLGAVPMLADYHGSIDSFHGPAWAVTGGTLCPPCRRHADADTADCACLAVYDAAGRWRVLHGARPQSWTARAEHPAAPAPPPPTPKGYRRLTDRLCTRKVDMAGPITRWHVYRVAGHGGPILTRWFIDHDRYDQRVPQFRHKVLLSGGDTRSGMLGAIGGACALQCWSGRTLTDAGAFLETQDWTDPAAWDET